MRSSIAGVLAIALSCALTGCFDDPDIAEVVDLIAWEVEPARLEPRAELRFGRGSLSLARSVCGWVEECEEYGPLLEGIQQAHIGVYELDGSYPTQRIGSSHDLRFDLESEGWHVALHAQERRGQTVLALTRVEYGELTGLYVVTCEDDEIVVVKLEGELSRPLDLVLRRDDDFAYAMQHVGEEF